jgi:hypothetical protein
VDTQNPQEAFFSWLGRSLGRALDAMRGPDRELDYLSAAVDHADLERRMRVIQRGMPSPLAALTHFHP